MTTEELLSHLGGVRRTARGWKAQCPAHDDKSPSLSIGQRGGKILLHCFAGCDFSAIIAAIQLEAKDLFIDVHMPRGKRPLRQPRVGPASLAFQFDLAALDRRQRAEKVMHLANGLDTAAWSDGDWDIAIRAVCRAYTDLERATLLEEVADDLRNKPYTKRFAERASNDDRHSPAA